MERITVSVIKADVGSIGGHTEPSVGMLNKVADLLNVSKSNGLLTDFKITHTGDDIALIMSHRHGVDAKSIHTLAWDCFQAATAVAKDEGLYGAGQDLLVDAPSGNVRGAGPAVAEIEFDLLPRHRPAEAMLIFAADKCGPGAYNHHLYQTLANPMRNGGLLLSPKLYEGFIVTVIDMEHTDGDRIIRLALPEEHLQLAVLLRQIDRYAVLSVHSRVHPEEQLVSLSATRLHNIAGKYTGKDDPVMIFRAQGIFPAPEEVVDPYRDAPFVTGDARGSHTMTLMPMPVNSAVRGAYCQPIVSCLALSVNGEGRFSEGCDMFGGLEWERARAHALQKSESMRQQGFFGVAMANQAEIAYTGLQDIDDSLQGRFLIS